MVKLVFSRRSNFEHSVAKLWKTYERGLGKVQKKSAEGKSLNFGKEIHGCILYYRVVLCCFYVVTVC